MKPLLVSALLAGATLFNVAAHAAVVAPRAMTSDQVHADLYRAYLSDETGFDEKFSYPNPPSNHAEVSALRCAYATAHPGSPQQRSIVKEICHA